MSDQPGGEGGWGSSERLENIFFSPGNTDLDFLIYFEVILALSVILPQIPKINGRRDS